VVKTQKKLSRKTATSLALSLRRMLTFSLLSIEATNSNTGMENNEWHGKIEREMTEPAYKGDDIILALKQNSLVHNSYIPD
jgi:hypothetical protein